jgi:hypothetical protein
MVKTYLSLSYDPFIFFLIFTSCVILKKLLNISQLSVKSPEIQKKGEHISQWLSNPQRVEHQLPRLPA